MPDLNHDRRDGKVENGDVTVPDEKGRISARSAGGEGARWGARWVREDEGGVSRRVRGL